MECELPDLVMASGRRRQHLDEPVRYAAILLVVELR
jgi:hypothetical protein